MRLYHYTCAHSRTGIIALGALVPHPTAYRNLIWLTDLDQPDVLGLGLTQFMIKCDRTAYKIIVETDLAVPWIEWAHDHRVPFMTRLGLDGNPGAKPLNWWVCESEIPYLGIEPTFKIKKGVH